MIMVLKDPDSRTSARCYDAGSKATRRDRYVVTECFQFGGSVSVKWPTFELSRSPVAWAIDQTKTLILVVGQKLSLFKLP